MGMGKINSFLEEIIVPQVSVRRTPYILHNNTYSKSEYTNLYLVDKLDINGRCACARYAYGYQGS
jgi:hypothetical protein